MTETLRRALIGAVIAALMMAVGPPTGASAQPVPTAFGSVAVDVEPLIARGLGSYAEFVRSALLAETRQAFADRVGVGGPTLVVRITGLSLSSYVGGGGGDRSGRGGGGSTDYLEGEAFVVGRDGQVVARYPQLLALPSSYGGAWYTPGNEQRRTAALVRIYAGWLRRTVAG